VSTYFIQGYFAKNLEDDLMIEILASKIKEYDKDPSIVKIKGKCDKIKILFSLDFFVRIGGSLYQEFPNNNSRASCRYFYRLEQLFNTFKIFRREKTKIVLINNSIGPIFSEDFERELIQLFKLADFISVRDKFSFEFLTSRGINAVYAPDIVFLLNDDLHKLGISRIPSTERIIGLSLLPFQRLYYGDSTKQNLINSTFAKFLSLILSTYKDIQVLFFEFCKNEGDRENFNEVINNIGQRFREKISIISYNGDISNFLREMSKCTFFICNRFHSIILSIILGIPFIAINHHPKVHNFLRDIGLEDYEIDVERVLDLNFVDDLVSFVLSDNKPRLSPQQIAILSNEALNNFKWLEHVQNYKFS
jgi:colanic acid/amylovoran biosynthesis protein